MIARCPARTAGLLLALSFLPPALAEKPSAGRTVGTHAGGIASVDFSPDGKLLATGGGDKMIRVWDVASGRTVHEWKGPTSFTCAVRFSPDGKTVAAAGYETEPGNAIYRFDVATGKELPRLPGHATGGARRLAFTPDGRQLVSGGFDGHVRVWDLATRKERRAFKVESGTVYGLALSPDGRLVATAGRDGLKLWEVATGKEQPREAMGRHSCVAVAFAPDGKLVASGDGERVKLWEAATGKEVAELKGFKGELSQLVFSRDGRTLFTASYDRFVRLWDVRSGRLVHEVEAHAGWVWGLALSADEKSLASCSVDTRLLVWEVAEFAKAAGQGAARLSEKQLESHWKQLASADAGAAFQAVCALAGDPDTSLPLLEKRLTEARPSGPGAADIARWIRELDSDVYRVREAATRELGRLGVRALPPLQQALANPPSLEVKKRAQRLVARLDPTELPPEELVALRGVQALEYMATPEARQVLEQLARGQAGDRVGDEAGQAVARLRQSPRR
ncbi:MAG: PQQ-binding-like beta-propeller repeat protein [Gemmataceae bacterium]